MPDRAGLVDWSGPLDQVAGNVEVLQDIVGAYVEEIRENLSLLPKTIAEEQWADARRQAHTVKGAMRMFGIQDGIRHGQALEDAAAAGEGGCQALFESLRVAAEESLPELEAFAASGKLPGAG